MQFRHEKDSALMDKLYESAVSQKVESYIEQYRLEEIYNYLHKTSLVRLTKKSAPALIEKVERACKLFAVEEVPELYLTRDYYLEAKLQGYQDPYIIISSDYLERLDDKMLYGLLASQVAGIKANHHKTMFLLWSLDFLSMVLPEIKLVADVAANQWLRCRYFTYDRAFLLATKDYKLTMQHLLVSEVPRQDLEGFGIGTSRDLYKKQVATYKTSATAAKTFFNLTDDREWTPDRYEEIRKYAEKNGFVIP